MPSKRRYFLFQRLKQEIFYRIMDRLQEGNGLRCRKLGEQQKPWGNSGCDSEWGGLDIVGGHGRIQGGEQIMERTVEGSCSRLQEPELSHGFCCSRFSTTVEFQLPILERRRHFSS